MAFGQHADDVERLAVHGDGLSDGGGTPTEALLPERMGEDGDARLTLRRGLRGVKRPPDRRRNAESREEVRGHRQARHALGLAADPQVQLDAAKPGHRLEDAALLQIAKVQVGVLVAVARLDAHHSLRLGHLRLIEERGPQEAEERQVGAESKAQREHADQYQSRAGAQHASRATKICEQVVHVSDSVVVVHRLIRVTPVTG